MTLTTPPVQSGTLLSSSLTLGTPHQLGTTLAPPGMYMCQVDISLLTSGAITLTSHDQLRATSNGGVLEVVQSTPFTGPPFPPGLEFEPIDCQHACDFFITQTSGTLVNYDWAIYRVDGGLASPSAEGTASFTAANQTILLTSALATAGVYRLRFSVRREIAGDNMSWWNQHKVLSSSANQQNFNQANPIGAVAAGAPTILVLDPIVIVNAHQFNGKMNSATTAPTVGAPRLFDWTITRYDS